MKSVCGECSYSHAIVVGFCQRKESTKDLVPFWSSTSCGINSKCERDLNSFPYRSGYQSREFLQMFSTWKGTEISLEIITTNQNLNVVITEWYLESTCMLFSLLYENDFYLIGHVITLQILLDTIWFSRVYIPIE